MSKFSLLLLFSRPRIIDGIGSLCLVFFATWIVKQQKFDAFAQSQEQTIIPPSEDEIEPAQAVPVERKLYEDRLRDRREKMTSDRKIKEEEEKKQIPPPPPEPGPNRYGAAGSLHYPTITTSDGRKDYHTDMAVHFSFFWRFSEKNPDQWNWWTGIRLASFSGVGTQNGYRGRYGFLYFGPMIGAGRFAMKEDHPRWVFLANAGVAGCFKGESEKIYDESRGNDDFKRDPMPYEAPGVWGELRWNVFFTPKTALGPALGIQLGKGKTFIYGGAELSVWH